MIAVLLPILLGDKLFLNSLNLVVTTATTTTSTTAATASTNASFQVISITTMP